MAFSRLTYPGDGSTVSFTINFPLGFLSRSDVVAYVRGELDGLGGQIYRTITWINDGLITISGAAPTVGQTLVIDRTVSKTSLKHSYANGVPIEASNLDESNKQAIMAVHEVLDGRFSGSQGGDFNLGTNRVINMGNAVDPQDAVTLSQLQDYTGNAPAYAQAASNSASAASASATAAGSAKTSAESARDAAQAAAAGMKWRPEVVVATTANITLSGTQTIDGVAVIAGDLVLVKNQTTTANNGVYVVAAGAWTRATDADTWSELVSQVRIVSRGSTNADLIFICTSDAGGTLGTTAVTWAAIQLVIADDSLTYVKINSAAFATTVDEIISGTASKIINAATLKLLRTTPPILQVQCTQTSGTAGGQCAATGSWQDSNLKGDVLVNTTVINNISGASLVSGIITLPAGTYKISGWKSFINTGESRARFYNITDSIPLAIGSSTFAGGSGGTDKSLFTDTFITLAATKTLKLQTWTTGTSGTTNDFGSAVSTGDTEVYGNFLFEKVA